MTKVNNYSETANYSVQLSSSANEKGIQIFNNQEFGSVRVISKDGMPLFCLVDVCKILEIGNPSQVKARLGDGVISNEVIYDGKGRVQQATFINEDALYDVVFDSRKPEAKQFRKWVTGEVLPSIRKHGGYMVSKENETTEELMARALVVAQETLKRKEQRLLEAENKIK